MEIEVSKKANVDKGIHSSECKTYRYGTQLCRFAECVNIVVGFFDITYATSFRAGFSTSVA